MATQFTKLVEYKSKTVLGDKVGDVVGGAADLVTGGTFNNVDFKDINKNVAVVPSGSGIVDVVNEFDWNANHINQSYGKLPKIFLTEREQVESSLISSYFYFSSNILKIIGDGVNFTGDGASSSVNQIIDKVKKFVTQAAGNIQDKAGIDSIPGAGKIKDFVKFFTSIYDELQDLANNDKAILGEYLKSYLGIYLTRETGFIYVLPYFQNEFQSADNNWSSSDRSFAWFDAFDAAANTVMPLVKPGVYIERPRFFDFQSNQGDSITVEFPLLNTVSDSYQKNYEFLWLLAFQNKYYRESFASVRPPKIYTVQIPGVKYMPYAYISDLTIDFVGTRRLLKVDTPKGEVEAPIPDAYQVRITIQSLLSDSSNALVSDQFYKQIKTATV